jgi:ATP-dependent DNA helicase RecG
LHEGIIEIVRNLLPGINKMRGLMAEAGLPPIVFEFGTFFTAIFRRPARIEPTVFDERGGVFGGIFGGINEKVAERMGKVIKALYREQVNISQLTVMTGIPKRTLERDIALLKDKGFTEFEGAPKTGRYILTEKGKKTIEELRKDK